MIFKKKERIIDLRKNRIRKQEIPIPDKLRERIENDIRENSVNKEIEIIDEQETKNNIEIKNKTGIGGFFSNFFGGSSSSSTSNSSSTEESSYSAYNNTSNPSSTTTINSTNSYSTATSLSILKKRVEELSKGISRLTDRIELLERKVERLEGR